MLYKGIFMIPCKKVMRGHEYNTCICTLSLLSCTALCCMANVYLCNILLRHCMDVIVISRCEYNILVIARVQGGDEDEGSNQDIAQAYPGYDRILYEHIQDITGFYLVYRARPFLALVVCAGGRV